jgi:transcriptional regulator
MILTILAREPMHGYGISQKLAALSHDQFHVNPGSLFPSLYRLEQDGKLKAEWRATENNRRAKYYSLTPDGRTTLKRETRDWETQTAAIARILRASPEEL